MTRSHHAIGWAYALVCAVLVNRALKSAPVIADVDALLR
jgi:hypothetical protein